MPGGRYVTWDGRTPGPWQAVLAGAAGLIDLTGRPGASRRHARHRRSVLNAPVASARVLGQALAGCSHPPPVWINASTAAIYGDTDVRMTDEFAPPGAEWSCRMAHRGETAFAAAAVPGVRQVVLRLGTLLHPGGGLLPRVEPLVRWGRVARIGSGQQYLSWLHADDLCRMVDFCLEQTQVAGVYNATAPTPVRNRAFMRALGRTLGVRTYWPLPAPLVPLLPAHGGAPLLPGCRALPARLLRDGFAFAHPALAGALNHLYGVQPGAARSVSDLHIPVSA